MRHSNTLRSVGSDVQPADTSRAAALPLESQPPVSRHRDRSYAALGGAMAGAQFGIGGALAGVVIGRAGGLFIQHHDKEAANDRD